MKTKAIIMAVIALVLLVALFGWFIPKVYNKQIWDFTMSFERALIQLPDGDVIEGRVTSWKDFSDGDQIQVKMDDGHTYLLHSSNVCLISE